MKPFSTVKELVELAKNQHSTIAKIMIDFEVSRGLNTKEEIIELMRQRLQIMKDSAQKGTQGIYSHSGLSGGDGKRLHEYLKKGKYSTDSFFVSSLMYAVAVNEVNASMGVICATPTAGSAGVLPGVLLALADKYHFSDEELINAMFTAGAFGFIIANNAFISGAEGGCQAEIGSASAMTAAALTELMGGDPEQVANAMAIALKNMLGLTCDPVAGLVEVPCIKRNAAGASTAIMASELALAGIESKIPWDEVIDAMYRIGTMIHVNLKETSLGGLADTDTGKIWKEKLRRFE